MRSSNTLRLACAAFLIWVAGALPVSAETRHVVLLYDERITLPGLSVLDGSLVRTLTSSSPDAVEVYREEMDLSRFGSETYPLLLRDHLRAKYADKKIDVAVAVMGPALDFLLSYGDIVFPRTPIVFTGVGKRELGGRPLPSHVTGIFLKREFLPTLELALRLHPDTRRIVIVAGTSEFDTRLVERARKQFLVYEDRLAFTYLTALPLQELLTRLSQLPPRTVVLYTTMFQDGAGEPFVPHDVAERVSAAANAPVYGFVDQYLGRGIVGGRLYSLDAHGEEAAKLTLQILAGADPSSLSPVESSSSVIMFDGRQLKRWKISESWLPPEAIVRFRPPSLWSLWSQYQHYVIGAMVIVALQTLMIIGLLVHRSRRRRAEAELRESEAFKGAVLESALDAIITMDHQGKIIEFNPAAEKMFGCDRAGVIGKSVDELSILSILQKEYVRSLASRLGTGESRMLGAWIETQAMRVDGSRFPVELSVTRVDRGESPVFTGYVRDLTERKRSEIEAQRHREELAHVTRVATIGELTASVAHELKQPLAAILSNAEAAELFLEADPPALEEVREILADIRKDDDSAAEIIAGMRSLLRKQGVARQPIEINKMVEEIVKLVGIEGAARKVAIKFAPAHDLPCVSGERVHLQQVVMNLVLNALESMDAVAEYERRLDIRTGNGENGMVKIAVSDSGPGIPAEKLAKLFEPFFTTKKEGLGMGLSITRTIVEAHEGRVWAENNADAGATFHVTLPAFKEGAA